jgi:hypothetical protein
MGWDANVMPVFTFPLRLATQDVAFDLNTDFFVSTHARPPVNVIDNLPVINNLPPGGKITCLSSYGRGSNFYVHVGTSEGAVYLYYVNKSKTQNNTDFFASELNGKRMLGKGKKDSVLQLECIAEGAKLVGLTSAGDLQVMSPETLDVEETINTKGFKPERIVIEKNSPLMGVACVTKRQVVIYIHRQGEYKQEKEITLKDVPIELEWTKGKLFIAYKTRYTFLYLDTDSAEEQLLEEIASANQKVPPAISMVGDQLLLRQGKQGFFFTFSGKKTGKKLEWSNTPLAVGYRRPFVVSLQEDQIEVHNQSEEAAVQVIRNTHKLDRVSSEGPLLLGSSGTLVFCLQARSWDLQIQQLLKARRIEDAFNLFKTSVPASIPLVERERMTRDMHKAAGVVCFSTLKFGAAVPYLKDSDLDVRELIAFFPGYLPRDSRYKARHGLTLEFLITETLVKVVKEKQVPPEMVEKYTKAAQEAVLEILQHRREKEGPCTERKGSEAYDMRRCLDTAVIKLMVDLGGDDLAGESKLSEHVEFERVGVDTARENGLHWEILDWGRTGLLFAANPTDLQRSCPRPSPCWRTRRMWWAT